MGKRIINQRNRKMRTRLLAGVMAVSFLTACGNALQGEGGGEKEGREPRNPEVDIMEELEEDSTMDMEEMNASMMNFSFELLKSSMEETGEYNNVLVSPVSVAYALNMTAIGAEGDTYDQIADLLCAGAAKSDLIAYVDETMEHLQKSDALSIANAVWANETILERDNMELNPDFKEILDDAFDAKTEMLPFDDDAVDEINDWVNDNTDEMIPEIIRRLDEDAILVLVNAMAFDSNWETPYEEYQVDEEGEFTNARGETEEAKMLMGEEFAYLENDTAIGFLKYYEDDQFAFMAILPNDEDVSLQEFLENFDGEDYMEFYESRSDEEVKTLLPAFTFDYDIELSDVLEKMGMEDAFDPDDADFSGMFVELTQDVWIDQVIHKTHVELDENGTRAAAATAVIMNDTCAMPVEQPKRVILDRPFLFAIVDMETGLPVFLGGVNSVED
ncbi:MAG: serpin family protein [Lachnospiraceae bacterium]